MNLKEEIMDICLLRVNQELKEYDLPPVELSDDGISTRMNIYRI